MRKIDHDVGIHGLLLPVKIVLSHTSHLLTSSSIMKPLAYCQECIDCSMFYVRNNKGMLWRLVVRKIDHDVAVHGLLLPVKIALSHTSHLLTTWQYLER